MAKCPECGSTQIEQYMMPYGPMWCLDCGFRVEEKWGGSNPFLEAAEEEDVKPNLSMGAALYDKARAGQETQDGAPHEGTQGKGDHRESSDDESNEANR